MPINSVWIELDSLAFQGKASDAARLPILAEHEADNLVGYLLLGHGRELELVDAADQPAKAQDRDPIAQGARFPDLVGNENDGHALVAQPLHDLAQMKNALWRQHRGRLVQNEHACAAPKCVHDFDLLLFAKRKPFDRRVRIDRDAEKVG